MSAAVNQSLGLIWDRLVKEWIQERSAEPPAISEFLSNRTDRVSLLRYGLGQRTGSDRAMAIALLRRLPADELQQLFPELIQLVRSAHGPIEAVQNLILSLSRSWVLERIEGEIAAVLQSEEYDDYWMFLELARRLDLALTRKLAQRAADHTDPEIQELGQDWLQRVGQP